jgi:hypothetical protein
MVTGERLTQQDTEASTSLRRNAFFRRMSLSRFAPITATGSSKENRTDGDDGHRKLTELYDEIELLPIAA